MVRSKIAQRMFVESEVLVAAKQLTLLDGIDIAEDATEVKYFHFLFDPHKIVCSIGTLSESLFTGPTALNFVSDAAQCSFPEQAIHARRNILHLNHRSVNLATNIAPYSPTH